MFSTCGYNGGWGGIRTHEGVAPLPVFKTGAFNHSTTHPHVNFIKIIQNKQNLVLCGE